ncbi:MAG: hypothetical protein R3E32_21490 [Chitinophagales bacterium]
MKKLILILFIFSSICCDKTLAQEIYVDGQNKNYIKVRNDLGYTHKFTLLNNETKSEKEIYLTPNSSGRFDLKLSRKNIKKYSIITTYDINAYKQDLKIIQANYESRERQRRNDIIGESILRGLDEFFTGGKIFGFIDVSKLVIDAINGKDLGEWTEDLAITLIEKEIVDQMDTRAAKAAATSAFALKGLLQEKEYKDLDRRTDLCIERLGKGVKRETKLTNKIRRYPRYELSIEGTLPLKNEYTYTPISGNLVAEEDYKKNVMPYSIRMNHLWKSNKSRSIFYIPMSYSQSPLLINSLFPETALSFNHIDLCLGYGYRIIGNPNIGLDLNLEIGGRANFRNSYSNVGGNDFGKIESFEYDEINPLLNGGITLDLKLFKLIGRYSYTLQIDNKPKNTISNLTAEYYQVGLAIPLFKKYKFY